MFSDSVLERCPVAFSTRHLFSPCSTMYLLQMWIMLWHDNPDKNQLSVLGLYSTEMNNVQIISDEITNN